MTTPTENTPQHVQKEALELRNTLCVDDPCALYEGCGCLQLVEAAILAAEERGAARERERCVGIVESGSNAALRLLEVNDPDEAEVRIVSFVLSKACTQLANKIRGNSA